MKNNYKGSPMFNQIDDVKLRTWNRCAIMFNLMADRGQVAASEYAKALGEEGQKQVLCMFDCIRKFGYEAVRKQIKVEGEINA